jgi:DNA-binding LacI/PurR family transcriptional regulator
MKTENYLNWPVIQKVIAKHSEVLTSLVSRILSGRLEKAIVVSAEKEFRVRRVVEEQGYRGLS